MVRLPIAAGSQRATGNGLYTHTTLHYEQRRHRGVACWAACWAACWVACWAARRVGGRDDVGRQWLRELLLEWTGVDWSGLEWAGIGPIGLAAGTVR